MTPALARLARFGLPLFLFAAVATASDRLPSGTWVDQDDAGVHHSATSLGGLIVVLDGQIYIWNGIEYTNGPVDLEFIEILPGDSYGFVLQGPGVLDTGIVESGG